MHALSSRIFAQSPALQFALQYDRIQSIQLPAHAHRQLTTFDGSTSEMAS